MRFRSLLSLLALTGVAACGDSTGSGTAQLRIQITDAPLEYFASAEVTIGEVSIIPADGAPVVVTDQGGTFDLLTLQNGVTAALGELAIEAGDYVELRLVVQSATVTLADGLTFTDGTTTRSLVVPSGAQTGIKIRLGSADGEDDGALTITPGETILVVDFDVSQNFVIQGAVDSPAGIQGVLFTPLLRATVRDQAGSIAGTVTDASGPVENATVRAVREETDTEGTDTTAEVTAVTMEDGSYVLRFLAPGTYTVTVDGSAAAAQTVTVGEGQDVTGVDFSI
ncbi:MAG: DUF4382 domain-containing protein [Gemmatimonadales bacterium]